MEKKIVAWVKEKDTSMNPSSLPACVTLHFKMLGHQPSSVKRVQPWLAWAISCYWNILFKQSLQKLQSQDKWFTTQYAMPHSLCGSGAFDYIHSKKQTLIPLFWERSWSLFALNCVLEGCGSTEVPARD